MPNLENAERRAGGLIAVVTEREVIAALLESLRLPATPPERGPRTPSTH